MLRWAAASVTGLPAPGRAVLVDAIGTALEGATLPPELIEPIVEKPKQNGSTIKEVKPIVEE